MRVPVIRKTGVGCINSRMIPQIKTNRAGKLCNPSRLLRTFDADVFSKFRRTFA